MATLTKKQKKAKKNEWIIEQYGNSKADRFAHLRKTHQSPLKEARKNLTYSLQNDLEKTSLTYFTLLQRLNQSRNFWEYENKKQRTYGNFVEKQWSAHSEDIAKRYSPKHIAKDRNARFNSVDEKVKYPETELEQITQIREKLPRAKVSLILTA